MFKETNTRSLVKSLSFRILIIGTDLVIIYALTHKVFATVAITILTNIASTAFYFLHERFWNGVRWGRVRAR